jgi:hypothetical protein
VPVGGGRRRVREDPAERLQQNVSC